MENQATEQISLKDLIVSRRKYMGISQAEAVKRSGLSAPQWSLLEGGRPVEKVTVETIRRIGAALEILPSEIIRRTVA